MSYGQIKVVLRSAVALDYYVGQDGSAASIGDITIQGGKNFIHIRLSTLLPCWNACYLPMLVEG